MIIFQESFGSDLSDLLTYGKGWSWQVVESRNGQNYGVEASPRSQGTRGLWVDTGSYWNGAGSGIAYWRATLPKPVASMDWPVLFIGFAFKDRGAGAYPGGGMFHVMDSDFNLGLMLRWDAYQYLYVTRENPTTTLLTFDRPYYPGRWHYIELGMRISDTVGWIEARLDSVPAGSYYGTGSSRATANADTKSFAKAGARHVGFGGYWTTGTQLSFQDIVIMNDVAGPVAGQPNNDFIGDVQVAWLVSSGAGSHTDFAPGGTAPEPTNWQSVNKVPAPGDAKYVHSNVVGAKDTYAFADLPSNAVKVYSIQPGVIMKKSDAGARVAAPLVRWAGGPLEIPLGQVGLQGSYGWAGQVLENRPDNAAWTVADVNAIELGTTVVS